MKQLVFLAAILISATACKEKKGISSKEKKPESVNITKGKICTFNKNILASFPGQIIVVDDYVAWSEPRKTTNFIHIIEKSSKQEIASVGSIGNGPTEFITPHIDKGEGNNLILYDLSQKKQAILHIDSIKTGDNYLHFTNYIKNKRTTRIKGLSNDEYILFSPITPRPFGIYQDGKIYYSGKYPISDDRIMEHDKYSLFQGEIAYSQQNGMLLYSTYAFKYLALYKKEGRNFQLIKDTPKTIPRYSFSGKDLHLGTKTEPQISEIALTKNYIVTAEFLNEEKNKALNDSYFLPSNLFVYNYNLKLIQIIRIDKPIWRISADTNSNTVYAIIEDPDYIMISVDIS